MSGDAYQVAQDQITELFNERNAAYDAIGKLRAVVASVEKRCERMWRKHDEMKDAREEFETGTALVRHRPQIHGRTGRGPRVRGAALNIKRLEAIERAARAVVGAIDRGESSLKMGDGIRGLGELRMALT